MSERAAITAPQLRVSQRRPRVVLGCTAPLAARDLGPSLGWPGKGQGWAQGMGSGYRESGPAGEAMGAAARAGAHGCAPHAFPATLVTADRERRPLPGRAGTQGAHRGAGRRGRLDQATGQRPGRRSSGDSARTGRQRSGPGWCLPLWWGRQGLAPGPSSDRLESPGSLGFPICTWSGWSRVARHSLGPPNSAYVLLPDGRPGRGAGVWGGCVCPRHP